MNLCQIKTVFSLTTLVILLTLAGCQDKDLKSSVQKQLEKSRAKTESGRTIGELAHVFAPDAIGVHGYAIVGGLRGTGSAECPPQIRGYLTQYILRYLPNKDVNKFINSPNTAVVIVEAMMPISSAKGARFDIRVAAPKATQTTSLEGGRLYGTELRAAGTFGGAAKVCAYAEGPVYIDTIDGTSDKNVGFILNGGVMLDEYKIILSLLEPDYIIANKIRNKLIERFGTGVANAISAGQIELKIPPQYTKQKKRFISIVKTTRLELTSEQRKQRITELTANLASSNDKINAEIALEAIGKGSLKQLRKLLKSSDDRVRFHAARCMLNLGSDQGFGALRDFSVNTNSDYRIPALEAIGISAKRSDIAGLARRLLRDSDTQIRLAAYEQLRTLDDIAIMDELIGGDFLLEQVALTKEKMVFVSRSGQPRIAIFAGPLYCNKDIFIQSSDGNVTINALPNQKYLSIIRQIPSKADIPPISLQCSYELSDIIRTLGSEPKRKNPGEDVGLGVSYSQIISIIKKMTEQGALDCQFQAGAMPEISLK